MSTEPLSDAPPVLKANAIGLPSVIAYTAACIGPASAIALGLVAAVSFAGYATPIVVLLSFIAAVCASITIGEFAKRLPSAGSFFTYNSVALGRPAGFVTGHLLVFAYIIFVPAGAAATGTFLSAFFKDAFGIGIDENILLILVVLAIMALALIGIATSSYVDLVVLVIEMAVIVALAATILIKGAPGPGGLELFNPANSLNGKLSDLSLAMVFTVVIFTGFESGAVLAEESRNPRRTIPRGLLGAVIAVGIFYMFVSYSELRGVAPSELNAFVTDPSQLSFLTGRYWSPGVTWVIDLVVALSTLAFTISTFNSGARLLFAMGREHMLPRRFASISKRHTPHVAIFVIGLIAVVIALPVSLKSGGFLAFAYIGGTAGIAFIAIYISSCVAAIVIFNRQWRSERNIVKHIIVPLIAALIFVIPLVGTFYPMPAWPYNVLPYVALAWLALGIVIAIYLSKKHPQRLAAIGRVFVDAEPDHGQILVPPNLPSLESDAMSDSARNI